MPTLNWIGKDAVIEHHHEVPFRLLECDAKLSGGAADAGNMLIEGDNLAALKALLPYYKGAVKCIYIDPPYNTGNENWVYNDNVNSPQMRAWLGDTVGRDDLSRHDKWLCMMYPRLVLLRELLREDGAIFVSIDDNEVHFLRCLLDEIFGESNFIANVVWQKKQSPQNDAINLSDMHDHILVYAKRAKSSRHDPWGWRRNLLPRSEKQNKRYSNRDNDPRGPWTSVDYTCNKTAEERPNLYYPIFNPHTEEEIWPTRQRVWRYERETHEKNMQENRVWFGSTGKNIPRLKRFITEVADGVVPSTWWTREEAGDNQESRRELRHIFSEVEDTFATPKPMRLIQRILQLATDKDSLVLDSFAGSGTTGHAVLQLNQEDGGNRRFILVEMEPEICRAITTERLRRAVDGYEAQRGKKEWVAGLGGGFRYYRLGAPLFTADGRIRAGITFAELARHVFLSATDTPLAETVSDDSPLLGVHNGVAVYLLYNGILRDKTPRGGNALTRATLAHLPPHDGAKIIYGTSCRLSDKTLQARNITFRQIPYEV